jgi:hypothetical protein
MLKTVTRVTLDRLGLLHYARKIQRDIFTRRQSRLTPREIEAIYTAQYHEMAGYGKSGENCGLESDEIIKLAHAKAIMHVLPHIKKVLVGGCSSGMGVLVFRKLGLDAWGFEISPDLDRIVIPEVKAYIRPGSMVDIPFAARDNFDCLVTTDVLEHVQLKSIKRTVSEMVRLNCQYMAHMINHTAMTPDHMTLKPLKWWVNQIHPYYRLRSDLHAPETGNPSIYGLNGDPLHVYTFWERTVYKEF